jgi:zinc transport system substrate-binding protein
MIRWISCLAAAAVAAVAGSGRLSADPGPRVMASIQPLHSLIAGVMEGVGVPELVVRGTGSPHTYALKPSAARALAQAQIVFWIGEAYETFLEKPLATLSQKAIIVELAEAPGVTLLKARTGGAWGEHADAHGRAHAGHADIDGHLFLDIDNAKAIVAVAAATLEKVAPGTAGRYRANAARVAARLDALDVELRAALSPMQGRQFIVFHDAYQYLEKRYGLATVGAISLSPERRPGARHLTALRQKISRLGAVCVFSEPQFESSLVQTVVEDTTARTGVLDMLGAGLKPGPEAYFAMMRGLAKSLTDCLGG